MQKIWESLSKPEELKDRKLSDYFDLSFSALPHKVLAADKFEQSVVDLRKRFVDKSRDDYVFKPAYHKRIPADGVAFYMEGVWVRPIPFHSRVPGSFHFNVCASTGTSPNKQGLGSAHTAGAPCPIPLR